MTTRHMHLTTRVTPVLLLLSLLGTGVVANAATAKTSSGSCTSQNPAVTVIFAPGNAGNLIYGDSDWGTTANTYNNPGDPFNGGTVYTNGVFNVCSGSEDMTLSLSAPRFINLSFATQVTPAASGANSMAPAPPYQMMSINLRAVYSLTTVGGSLNTCLDGSFIYNKNTNYKLRFENPNAITFNGGDCFGYTVATAPANDGGNTSLITVTHPDACTWVAQPALDDTGIYYRGGVVETISRTTYSGGQYNLPFAIKMVKQGCTP